MGKPSFIGIGVLRSGTTYFYRTLCKHPDIHKATVKELHFFTRKFNKGYKWYEGHLPDNCVTGEMSGYMFHPLVPYEIKRKYPNTVIIAMLRNPVDRAYSHYWHNRHNKRQNRNESFEKAIARELKIKSYKAYGTSALPYLAASIYSNYVPIWKNLFNKTMFIKSEDYFKRPQFYLNRVYKVLGVKEYKVPNIRKVFKNARKSPSMNPKIRKFLTNYFKVPNKLLKKMVGITW